MPRILQVLLLASLVAPPTVADTASAHSDYVWIDVVARGHDGSPVTDLTLDDFVLTEGGARVNLWFLDRLDLLAPSEQADTARHLAGTTEPPPAVPLFDRSHIVIALDLRHAVPARAEAMLDHLEEFLQGAKRRTGVDILLYSLEEGRLLDRSEDPATILTALERQREGTRRRAPAGGEPPSSGAGAAAPSWAPARDLAELVARFEERSSSGEGRPETSVGGKRSWVLAELDAYLEGQNARTEATLEALASLAADLEEPGTVQSVLLVSPGFCLRPGRAAVELVARYLYLGGMPLRQEYGRGRYQDFFNEKKLTEAYTLPTLRSFEDELVAIVADAYRNRLVFHTFDLPIVDAEDHGLSETHRAYRAGLHEGLMALADRTGGKFHTASTPAMLRKALEAGRFVYLLGYASPPGREGKFRRVKIRCRRDDVDLDYRTGYIH